MRASTFFTCLLLVLLGPSPAEVKNWVRNPEQPSQWIDLDSRKPDDEVIRFDVSLSTDSDTGEASTDPDDIVVELVNCTSGNRVMILPMLDNATRSLPTLSDESPLLRLICGKRQ